MLLPVSSSRRTYHIAVSVSLTHTTVLPPRSCLSTQLTVLHDGLADPVDARITTDCFVHGVDHDDFVVQVRGILTDPVRTQHAKCASKTSCSLFSLGSSTPLKLDLVDTFAFGFTVRSTLRYRLLTSTTSQTNTVDNVPLLGTVPESASFIGTGGSRGAMDGSEVTELPTSDTEQEAEQVALFLLVQFL